ncbi:MAG: HypC/HybG/HupF family hydrogenase formation chaperone [Desulfovibrionaceae bacterium]|nr:HypC/HybG/HupF family hydrogenase formation chaperone [Desulfovibrionaceae bacterium]
MCLAVPVKVEEHLEAGMLRCRVGESETFVLASDALLEDRPALGDYVIVHAGFALHRVEPEAAAETLSLLREIAAQEAGLG